MISKGGCEEWGATKAEATNAHGKPVVDVTRAVTVTFANHPLSDLEKLPEVSLGRARSAAHSAP